jgi:hypothetical protein
MCLLVINANLKHHSFHQSGATSNAFHTTVEQNFLANRQWRKPSSKSSSDWREDHLSAFKITLKRQDSASFFGVDPLPHSIHIPAAILTDLSPNERTQDRETYCFLRFIKEEMRSAIREYAIDDFTQATFRLMRYQDQDFLLRFRVDLTFCMRGEERHAQTDLCLEPRRLSPRGEDPITDTKVLKNFLFFLDGFDEGMVPFSNRLVALKCYDAFKAFVFRDRIV